MGGVPYQTCLNRSGGEGGPQMNKFQLGHIWVGESGPGVGKLGSGDLQVNKFETVYSGHKQTPVNRQNDRQTHMTEKLRLRKVITCADQSNFRQLFCVTVLQFWFLLSIERPVTVIE